MIMRSMNAFVVAAAACGVALHLSIPAWSETAPSCGAPLEANGGWQAGSLEEAGLDAARLCSLGERLDKSPERNVHAVVVVRGGKLVYETYRAGEDQKWGTKLGTISYTAEMPHDVRSISKSVVSLLVGIALDRKLIASVDDPVFTDLPEYEALRTPEKDRIRLRHLLTMTSGLAWDEQRPYSDPLNSEIRMVRSPEPYRFALEQKVWQEPDKKWNYSGGSTQLLAGVLQKATGEPLATFANAALFEPLGITQFEWVKMPANGEAAAASGLRLRPRDMAKIGQLVLDKGVWNGRRIVSEAWIEESTKARFEGWYPHHYGYQWWVSESQIGERKIAWIAGWGLGGQRIYIVPDHDLVLVITAGLYASDSQDSVVLDILDNYVLAAVRQ
jgi:CubicO group peptidase (beta-lactamase class C family)